MTFTLPPLVMRDMHSLRELVQDTLMGAVLDDDAIRAGIASYWQGAFASWKSDDGRCSNTLDTWLLVVAKERLREARCIRT